MSRLWIFGCSHTTPCGVDDSELWAVKLANKLGVEFGSLNEMKPNPNISFGGHQYGDGGAGIDIIFMNVMTKLNLSLIKPEDIVIFNASYSTRVNSTSHVSRPTQDKRWVNWHMSLFEKYFRPNWGDDYNRGDLIDQNFKHDKILFAHWYLRQKFAYQMLKDTGAEVYQWLLEPQHLLEDVLSQIDEDTIEKEIFNGDAQIFESMFPKFIKTHQGWENLLKCPTLKSSYTNKEVNCWSDVFSDVYPLQYQKNSHMNAEGNEFFSDTLYKLIMEYRNENK